MVCEFYFSCSVVHLCLTLCDPMDCSMPGFPAHHHLPSSLKFMSIQTVMLSKHLVLFVPFSSCLQSFLLAIQIILNFILRIISIQSVQFSCSVMSDSLHPMNRSTPGLPVHHQLLESTKPMSIESVMSSNYLILCRPLLLLP